MVKYHVCGYRTQKEEAWENCRIGCIVSYTVYRILLGQSNPAQRNEIVGTNNELEQGRNCKEGAGTVQGAEN
jgi:hypothetical protein